MLNQMEMEKMHFIAYNHSTPMRCFEILLFCVLYIILYYKNILNYKIKAYNLAHSGSQIGDVGLHCTVTN